MTGFSAALVVRSNPKLTLSHRASSLEEDISSQERASSEQKLRVTEGRKSRGLGADLSGRARAGLWDAAANESGIENIPFP